MLEVGGLLLSVLAGWLAVDWWIVKRESWRPVRAGDREGLCAAPATPPIPPLFRRPEPVTAIVSDRRPTLKRVREIEDAKRRQARVDRSWIEFDKGIHCYTWGGDLIRTIQSQLYHARK
jgi:hypothetical protein